MTAKNDLDANLALTADITPLFVPISSDVIHLLRNDEGFCRTICSGIEAGQRVPFALIGDNFLVCSVDEFEQLKVPKSLVTCVKHFIHYAKIAGYPGGRHLYQVLLQSLSLSNISTKFYLIVLRRVSCAKNKMSLRRYSEGVQLFPTTAPLMLVGSNILSPLLTTKRGN